MAKGSIPAHAGKPSTVIRALDVEGVYPRPRGETLTLTTVSPHLQGLSPPTRGNRRTVPVEIIPYGSIPAHAGKPVWTPLRYLDAGVYPRPRGETLDTLFTGYNAAGLSPPTRGNRHPPVAGKPDAGSIPAHAGKPATGCRGSPAARVYPRPRGETPTIIPMAEIKEGLSPPTRGNLKQGDAWVSYPGSIPAHAGKPNRL